MWIGSANTISKAQPLQVTGIGAPTFSALPVTPTKVPLLVYNFCEADNETDKSENGVPSTSNRASTGA